MDADPPAKLFVKQFIRASKLEVIESNLNIELLGRMNLVTAHHYEEVLQDAEKVERELTAMASANEEVQAVIKEVEGLGNVLAQLEHSVQFLEEVTSRLELKFKSVQGFSGNEGS